MTYICPGVVYSLNASWSHHQTTASPAGSATATGADDSLGVYLSRDRGLAASGGANVCTVLQNGRARAGPLGGCRRRAKVLDAGCELVGGLGHGCGLAEGGGHCVCQRGMGNGYSQELGERNTHVDVKCNEWRWDKGGCEPWPRAVPGKGRGAGVPHGRGNSLQCVLAGESKGRRKQGEKRSGRSPSTADISERNESPPSPMTWFPFLIP